MVKKSKAKKEVTLIPIPEDLRSMTSVQLREQVEALQTRIAKAAADRAYMQVERDMVSRVLDVCRSDIEAVTSQLMILDLNSEQAAEDHSAKVKAFHHRAIALAAESQTMRDGIKVDTVNRLNQSRDEYSKSLSDKLQERILITAAIDEEQTEHDEEIANLQVVYANNLVALRSQFEQQHKALEKQLDDRHAGLAEELDLRHRVDVHELEERKNQHLAELYTNHQEAFKQIKDYYKEITYDNVQLIRKLQSDIEQMKANEKTVQQNNFQLTLENKHMSEPMAKLADEKSRLSGRAQLHSNNLSSLRNMANRQVEVDQAIKDAKRDIHRLEDKLKKTEREKEDIRAKFESGISEINKVTQVRNKLLHKKIEQLESMLPEGETSNVAKATEMDDLEYELFLATRSFIDTHKVLNAKLKSLGQPPLEGYDEDLTLPGMSSAPADLVGH